MHFFMVSSGWFLFKITHRNLSVKWISGDLICRTFSAVYRLPTGPNSGAGTRHRSAHVHCRVHRHAQLRQVPWAWRVFMLLPVLLWLVRRRMKRMHRWTCMCVFSFLLFIAQYFHSTRSRLHLHSAFTWTIHALRVNRLTLDHVVVWAPCVNFAFKLVLEW